MSYLEELLPEFRKGAKIRCKDWNKGYYIEKSGTYAVDRNGDRYFIRPCDIISDDWEFYQEPIDWDYIIKNKCLCWFWDHDEKVKKIGLLARLINKDGYRFERDSYNGEVSVPYVNCCPVCKDEVNFYEDKRDD